MKTKQIKLAILCFILGLDIAVTAQNLEYQVIFEGIGDNREYFNELAYPQTILGSRGAFELGFTSDNHRVRAGISHLFEFGSNMDDQQPKLTLYYQFSDSQKKFLLGAFPRRGLLNFPLAMITDTLLYYRPNIEGLYAGTTWEWGNQSGFVDWVSRQTDTRRENFMAGFSGEIFYNSLFLENFLLLYHDAGPAIDTPGDHIKDYLGYALLAGIRTTNDQSFNGSVKAGILSSAFRERSVTDGFMVAKSMYAEAFGKYKNYGIKSVLSSGGGHRFKTGDQFFRAQNYWRTDVIWYFINHPKVKGTFNLSFHLIDWKDLDQQQQMSVIYVFGG